MVGRAEECTRAPESAQWPQTAYTLLFGREQGGKISKGLV